MPLKEILSLSFYCHLWEWETKDWFHFNIVSSAFVLLDHFEEPRALNISFVVCNRRVAAALGTKAQTLIGAFDLKPFGTVVDAAAHYWPTCSHGEAERGLVINAKFVLLPKVRDKIHTTCEV